MSVIREKCALAMQQQGIHISDIVIATGLPDSTVRNALSPHSKSPSVNTIGPICGFLRVSLDDIFGSYHPGGMSKALNQREIDYYIRLATQAELNKNLRAELVKAKRACKLFRAACAALAIVCVVLSLII